jgi:anaerobic selenocysteine-containing dehydrogenase
VKTGDVVEVFNDRGSCVVPVYVTERCMPKVAVLYEGAWMDLDKNGVDRGATPTSSPPINPAQLAHSPTTPFWSASARPTWFTALAGMS